MTRRLAAMLTCALTGFGQRSRPDAPAPAAARDAWLVDALALDANGRPVTDLTAADFELAQGGASRKITNFTWFDTRLHTSVTRPEHAEGVPGRLDVVGRPHGHPARQRRYQRPPATDPRQADPAQRHRWRPIPRRRNQRCQRGQCLVGGLGLRETR